MASGYEEWHLYCRSDASSNASDDEWGCPEVEETDKEEGFGDQLIGQEALSALTQPVCKCPKCQGEQFMTGRNKYGSWKRCKKPSCKTTWGYAPSTDEQLVTAKHATTSSSTSVKMTIWRRIIRWLMTRAHVEFLDGVITVRKKHGKPRQLEE